MRKEYEVITNTQFRFLNSFLVKINSRALHLHKEIELGVVVAGTITLKTPPNSYKLTKGEVFLINSMEAHEFISSSNDSIILSVQISPTMLNYFFVSPPAVVYDVEPQLKNFLSEKDHDLLTFLCAELSYSYLSHFNSTSYMYKCFGLVTQILFLLEKVFPTKLEDQEVRMLKKQQKDKLRSIIEYIDDNYTGKILLKDIAKKVNLSLSYLSHLFKDFFGITFETYLTNKRFEQALQLLTSTKKNVLDISISCGFSDVKYLNKVFHNRFGFSPKEYRKKCAPLKKDKEMRSLNAEYRFSTEEALPILSYFKQSVSEKIKTLSVEALWE